MGPSRSARFPATGTSPRKLKWRRDKYRNNPEYAAAARAYSATYRQSHSTDPDWVRREQLRKDFYRVRDVIARRLTHVAKLEKQLFAIQAERKKLEQRLQKEKAVENGASKVRA